MVNVLPCVMVFNFYFWAFFAQTEGLDADVCQIRLQENPVVEDGKWW
jgi:hypothetical protein